MMTLRIVTTTILIFSYYFIIGLQLAVVPGLVHWRLGFSPVIAGLAISAQYAATQLSRPAAGRMGDKEGGKFAAGCGLLTYAASGVLLFLSARLESFSG